MLSITLCYFIITMLQRDGLMLLPVLVFLPLDGYTLFCISVPHPVLVPSL